MAGWSTQSYFIVNDFGEFSVVAVDKFNAQAMIS